MTKVTEIRIGKVCAKHPELRGKRLASNGNCIQCARDAAAKQHAARTMTVGQEITMLRGQLHKLQMENEELRKDAERYRWLRKTKKWNDAADGIPLGEDIWILETYDDADNRYGDELDHSIDYLMALETVVE